MWLLTNKNRSQSYLISKTKETNMLYRNLGKLNLKSIREIIIEKAIIGLPHLKIDKGKTCGECLVGKKTKMSYKKVQHLTTTCVLELFQIDLMGLIQVKSLGGKRYIFVFTDDYSINTWVDFIHEKYDTFAFLGVVSSLIP